MNCVTASGPQVTGTHRVDGQASTGLFAGARGAGHVTVDVATGQDTLSGTDPQAVSRLPGNLARRRMRRPAGS